MKSVSVLILSLLAASVTSFTSTVARPTRVVLKSTEGDSFDTYEQSDTQTLAYRDAVVGNGAALEAGNICMVKYSGRFMASGKEFDKSDSYVFRFGQGKVLPGWEVGLKGMKVGGKRTLRIPPDMAYGNDWFKGVIPPKSHLEFDVELNTIAASPQEEIYMQMDNFGFDRIAGFAFFTVIFAISPKIDEFIATIQASLQ